MFDISIKIEKYKCFKKASGFDTLKRVNIIIGRNNVGKSSLLDIIEAVASNKYHFDSSNWNNFETPQISLKTTLTQDVIDRTFSPRTTGGIIGTNHNIYGRKFIGREIIWTKQNNSTKTIRVDDRNIIPSLEKCGDNYFERLPSNIPIPIEDKVFRKVSAERDILPEPNSDELNIASNGNGITNVIQSFINKSKLSSELIEVTFLTALNDIFKPDAEFDNIVCQLHDNNTWEIFLGEKNKGRIALSKSGSGLKTIIIVLANLILIPELENKSVNNYIFGFEELENNIHPALLRRLNNYIYNFAVENNFIYFLTTHSNVVIDQFSKQSDAQIIHITQENSVASCKTVQTYIDNCGILDDLDVRASDLLQSNGIIWVEGPSDRIYLNRWIDLWSEGMLKEGTDYQIISYGDRLLSHLSAETPEHFNDGISILNTNRNSIIIIDSDKKARQSKINETKKRIQEEYNRIGLLCWITSGKEIENYISHDIVNSFLGINNAEQVEQYMSFFDYLDSYKNNEGKKYVIKKPLLAEKLVSFMTKENVKHVLDLDERMIKVCNIIKSWNR